MVTMDNFLPYRLLIFTSLLIFMGIFSCKKNSQKGDGSTMDTDNGITEARELEYSRLRTQMVQNQIVKRGIKDQAVLLAMRKVKRHFFVPREHWNEAYEDHPLPIGHNQTISQPYIVAFMTEALSLESGHRVLEIGTGSGYQAAVLAEIVRQVYTVEIVEPLGLEAQKILRSLNYQNLEVKIGDGYQGWKEKAPFDAIMVTAAPDHIPSPLVEQLKPGGHMIIPVGSFFQELILLKKKSNGQVEKIRSLPVRFVPMTGKAQDG